MNYGNLNDFELLTAAREGNEHAWRELQRRYSPQVFSQAKKILWRGLCRDPGEHCRDVSQEVWMQLWVAARKGLSRREGTEGVGGLLCAMTRHAAHVHLERDCRRSELQRPRRDGTRGDADEPRSPEAVLYGFRQTADAQVYGEEVWRDAQDAPVEHFAEMLEMQVAGLSCEEIAERFNLTPLAVRQRLARGRRYLRRRRDG